MKFTVTKEFVREAHGAACSTWKTKIEKEFPDLFKTELEFGKWYEGNVAFKSLIFITKIEDAGEYNRIYYYGFINNIYLKNDYIASRAHEASLVPASNEEVESALLDEAKKKGYKKGVRIKGLGNGDICTIPDGEFEYLSNNNALWFGNPDDDYDGFHVFHDGKWAEILPGQKTIITKG